MNRKEFQDFVREQSPALQRYFLSRGVLSRDVDDLVQHCLLVAWAKRTHIREGKAKSYLFGIAAHSLLAHRRKAALRNLREGLPPATPEGTEPTPGDTLAANERHALLEGGIAQLPPSMREAVELVCLQGRSHTAAAAKLGVNVNSLRQNKMRAIRHLREALDSDADR